jgi:hypothetical protein
MAVMCTAVVVAQVGYPLVTVLVCLVDVDNYTRQVESMADFLVKQMKVKEYRWGEPWCTCKHPWLQLWGLVFCGMRVVQTPLCQWQWSSTGVIHLHYCRLTEAVSVKFSVEPIQGADYVAGPILGRFDPLR